MHVPFVDLKKQYSNLKSEIDSAIHSVIENTLFIGGSGNVKVSAFEREFAAYLGLKHVMSCANGTDSLEILLRAMGIKDGDEVIVPALSWISTSESVSAVGGIPVFVDVDEDLLIDLSKIEDAITSKTKAIIPVHLYGNPVDMPALMKIAQKHNLLVMEDCAQSHGAMIGNQMVGTFGHCSSFSFYPGKNLGAYGDAGAMATNDDKLAELCRAIANHGQQGKHNHIMEGRNSRMDGIQAAVLSVKLPHLNSWTEARISNAKKYSEKLQNSRVITQQVKENKRHVFHLYVIRSEKRNELMQHLKSAGIETAIHYPVALPLMPCYAHRKFVATDFPVAARAVNEILSLPMYAELNDEQIQYVTEQIDVFCS